MTERVSIPVLRRCTSIKISSKCRGEELLVCARCGVTWPAFELSPCQLLASKAGALAEHGNWLQQIGVMGR